MAFSVLIQTLFSDSGASIALARANASLKQLEQSGPGASRGMRVAQQGMQQLAIQAAGVGGPLGRIAAGLLQFSGGNALVLGAAAGVGLVALAWRAYTKDATEAAEAERKVREELIKTAAQRAQRALPESRVIGADISSAREQLAALAAERKAREAKVRLGFAMGGGGTAGGGVQSIEDFLARDKELQRIDRERADLSLAIAQNTRAGASAAKDEAEAAARTAKALEEQRKKAAELAEQLGRARAHTDGMRNVLMGGVVTGRGNLTAGMQAAATAATEQSMPLTFQGVGGEVGRNPLPAAAKDFKDAAAIAVSAFGAMAAAAVSGTQNMAQTVIFGFTQIAQAAIQQFAAQGSFLAGPLGGAIIGVAGGLLGALFGGNKAAKVEVTNFDELKRQGPDRVTVQILSPSTGELLDEITYEMGRRARRDQVVRIPAGVSLAHG